ncbi:MAG: RNA methyltransferase [Firmicutes bacterium]|nr:RNA methyltransferase [Bacillota bacterium]
MDMEVKVVDFRTVSSKDNQIFKLCEKLAQKKYRDRLSCYLIEGENLVSEAVDSGQDIQQIVISDDAGIDPELMKKVEAYGGTVFMKGSLFEKAAQTENSQGILAVVSKAPEPENFAPDRSNILILDKLQDPGNLGTIIRTADAAGYGGIIAVKGTGDIYSPKVVRATAGSLFRVPVVYADTEKDALELAKARGKKVFCTSFDTDRMYYDADMSKDAAIVIGNEGNGVSETFIKEADELIKIPMRGDIDSLNAAVAAAVIMYHSVLQQGS